ncbi:hypothetical protein LBMAG47_16240 [Planctomycetia bacterium]|jgi:hypothetical protein|nr:hypothetical protein LBMAG47_16240 [Planctomycetia bacterium]
MKFSRHGIAFDYPDGWEVEVELTAVDRWAVTVHAPEGGFWSVSDQGPDCRDAEVAAAVAAQMRADYPNLDDEPATTTAAGITLPGHDINFYCLDLTNTAQIRTLRTPATTYLLFCQAEDREWDRIVAVFAAMTESFVATTTGDPRKTP